VSTGGRWLMERFVVPRFAFGEDDETMEQPHLSV